MKLTAAICILTIGAALVCRAADTSATDAPKSDGTSTNEAPVPGAIFTNSVKMILLKVPVGNFWAGQFEVTQEQYQKITGQNPSQSGGGATFPVDNVSWLDAMKFCQLMTTMDLGTNKIPKGYHYSLPSEDEWMSLVGDASLDDAVTSIHRLHRTGSSPAGSLGANNFGLYDIRGNVMEFCLADEKQPNSRFLKGGSWADFVEMNFRPEFRWYCKPDEHTNTFGFRCLLRPQ